jgi:hypothetical protein
VTKPLLLAMLQVLVMVRFLLVKLVTRLLEMQQMGTPQTQLVQLWQQL